MKKAFTLIEIMIVMSIIGILLAIGTAGLLQLRRAMEADQAGKNLVSILKESETMAKNNTLDASTPATTVISNIFGVKIRFDGVGGVWRSICRRGFTETWLTALATPGTCGAEVNLEPKSFANILLEPKTDINNDCNMVLMENLTDKFLLFRYTAPNAYKHINDAASTVNTCDIVIKLKDNASSFNKLTINSTNASFEVRPLP